MTTIVLAAAMIGLLAPFAWSQEPADGNQEDPISWAFRRTVKIYGAGGVKNLEGYGTGFLISSEGHVVTVWNHVLDADEVTIILNDGRRYPGKLLGAEPQLDVAVIKLQNVNGELPHFDLSDLAEASVGTRILGFSNMFKVATGDEPVSVLHGVISAKTKLNARRGSFEVPYEGPVYIVDAITNNPGAAGGVITTRDGKLLGVIGKELRNAQSNTWVNYAIPITELKEVIRQIITGNYIEKEKKPDEDENPNRYRPLDFGIVLLPDVVYHTPAYIESIERGSAAYKLGLRPDDLILFVNDELIQSNKMLQKELGLLEAGDMLWLTLVRGKDKLVKVETPVPVKEKK
jgi:serine protease Do